MRPQRFMADRTGTAALEFALICLPLVLLLLGLFEFGRGLHIRNAINAAADRAQRAIIIDPLTSSEALNTEIHKAFHAGPDEMLTISHADETLAGMEYRIVSLNYEMQLLVPSPFGQTITIGSARRVAKTQ